MRRHPRIRRIAKWTGLVLCVLIVVVWVVSLRWTIDWFGSYVIGGLMEGNVWAYLHGGSPWVATGWSAVVAAPPHEFRHGFCWPSILLQPHPLLSGFGFRLPCWLLLLVVGLPTAFLWHRDRRRILPGHCMQCGYNLTGNESGICPECGTEIQKKSVTVS